MSDREAERASTTHQPLPRTVGVFGATMMGLGSIVGTGIFVSVGIAAAAAGPAVVLALVVAAAVAACNGLSSAQLAANHPVSGGTYEYGHRWLHPSLGFTAGWTFLCAKSASAATAAIGFAGYTLNVAGRDSDPTWLAVSVIVAVTLLVLSGIRWSNATNIVIVSLTLLSLAAFVLSGLPTALAGGADHLTPFFEPVQRRSPLSGFLEATALMFVAYTGYGRIATLGEEIHSPRRNIPLAIGVTLLASMILYVAVTLVGVAAVGADQFSSAGGKTAAVLQDVARQFELPGVPTIVAVGAVTAMLGVLLNLILGLSRVVLAMGRRGDVPSFFATVGGSTATPYPAVILIGTIIAGLALIGDVKTTWSFSAFTVLAYYAITNLAALRLTEAERLYPRWIPWVGLVSCLFLAFWVERMIWMIGLGLIAFGLAWHFAARRLFGPNTSMQGDS